MGHGTFSQEAGNEASITSAVFVTDVAFEEPMIYPQGANI
jgi:hypothetical protein